MNENESEREGIRQMVHTETFAKAVTIFAVFFGTLQEMVLKKESFHTEIDYNAEAQNVKIVTLAPKA